jgi:hypothetical protein
LKVNKPGCNDKSQPNDQVPKSDMILLQMPLIYDVLFDNNIKWNIDGWMTLKKSSGQKSTSVP